MSLFAATSDVPDSEICDGIGVLVRKEDRRKAGNDLRKIRDAATKPIDPKFGVSKHFITSASGEAEDGDETRETYIQDSYAMNLSKVEMLDNRLVMYDLKTIFFVLTLIAGIKIKSLSTLPTRGMITG